MFETNVHVVLGENGERNRKYAEIYCENDTEMKTIDTSQYVVGTRCITVTANFKEYRLSKTQGKWYDSSGSATAGFRSDLGAITKTLTKATATGDSNAYYGVATKVTLTPDQYYDLPATITVTVGDAPKTEGTDYTYDPLTGEVVIKASVVTGAVVIVATATAQAYGDITETYTNITSTGDTTATHGEDIDVTLAANENYELPDTIIVLIGEKYGVADTDYTYDNTTGAIHIAGAKVTGAVAIIANAVGKSQGEIIFTLTNITASGDDEAFYGAEVNVVLTAADGYELPATITVEVGESELTVGDGYTYDAETGEVTIFAESVTDAVTITAVGVGG